MSKSLCPGSTPPPPSSALISPLPAYMTTTKMLTVGSLLIVCFLTSAYVAAVAVAAAAVAAAGVVDARSFIVAIEQKGSKPIFDALGQCKGAAQADRLQHAC